MGARLARGAVAGLFLLFRGLIGMVALGLAPLLLILGVLVPPVTTLLVQLAELERKYCARYLGVPIEPAAPVTKRRFWQVHKLFRDRAAGRAFRLLLMRMVLAMPTAFLGTAILLAVPSALAGMVFWPLDPGGPSLMGVSVDSWGIALTLGPVQVVAGLALLGWGAVPVARGYARLALRLLAPSQAELEAARLAARVDQLTRTRAGAVDSHGAELRRIERDLHDGTQAQLVSLAMRIGVAKQAMLTDPDRAAELLDDARDGAEQAMTELRGVLRSMYPPILADRGLAGAVSALAARCPVPAHLNAGELGDVPAAVEAAAYFVVAESLTNVAKHAAATEVGITMDRNGPDLRVVVVDNGIGGARIGATGQRSTGLAGMVHRVEAIDGHLWLDSPVGGPTTVEVTLPCE
jgi:signal transduction histidine kinase